MSPGNTFIWGQKVKGQGHQAQKQVCVGLQMERNIDACCVRKLLWVFHAAMPCCTNTGFSLRHFLAADAATDRRF